MKIEEVKLTRFEQIKVISKVVYWLVEWRLIPFYGTIPTICAYFGYGVGLETVNKEHGVPPIVGGILVALMFAVVSNIIQYVAVIMLEFLYKFIKHEVIPHIHVLYVNSKKEVQKEALDKVDDQLLK